jgi:hypothetical protein
MAGAPPRRIEPASELVDEAIAYEAEIAEEAAQIRAAYLGTTKLGKQETFGDDAPPEVPGAGMTRELFDALWPLLRKPIPKGFILEVTIGEGKPFASKGVRSMQVLVDRMNNVLGPLWWDIKPTYHDEGKLCQVVVFVFDNSGTTIASRECWGGMNRGSTVGNLYKGSFTNAAKRAFAALGPGHEVYLGVTDHDPDTDPDEAKQQARTTAVDRQEASENGGPADMEAELALLLAKKDRLQEKRHEAHKAMEIIGAGPTQRLRELRSAGTAAELDELITRAMAVADAQIAAQEGGAPNA